jgi:hypothetical protein
MDSEFFKSGNYIYECKSSPGVRMGEYFNTAYLRASINNLKARWSTGNYLNNESVILLQNLQKQYPDVDIRYYDCDQVQKLIAGIKKVGEMKSLVEYIEQVRREGK